MIHGNPTWSFYYRRLIHALSSKYRTIAPDHIGCGLSEKPSLSKYDYSLASRIADLESFVHQLNITGKITLVIHDWGGMIGMAFAVRHPDLISRIIVTNTAAFLPPPGKSIPRRLRMIRNLKFFSKPAVLGLNLFAVAALFMAPQKPLSKKIKRGLIAPYNSWVNRLATLMFVYDIPICQTDLSYDLVQAVSRQLSRFQAHPMLICWGKHDFVFDLDYLAEWQRRFPKAETHLFSTAGHYLLEDEPEAVIHIMHTFLTKTQNQ